MSFTVRGVPHCRHAAAAVAAATDDEVSRVKLYNCLLDKRLDWGASTMLRLDADDRMNGCSEAIEIAQLLLRSRPLGGSGSFAPREGGE
jgi:hypothetical protein